MNPRSVVPSILEKSSFLTSGSSCLFALCGERPRA
jgi:hypothetical protein